MKCKLRVIDRARTVRRWSKKMLAYKAGIDYATLYRFYKANGKHTKPVTIGKICDALQLTMDEVIYV